MLNNLTDLFSLLEKEFPYSSCGDKFLGAHHLIKDRNTGMLILNVWWENRLWQMGLTKEEDFDVKSLVSSIREMVEVRTNKQKRLQGLTKSKILI